MHRGNRRQPVAVYNHWAHEIRRLHGRDQVDDLEGNIGGGHLRNLLYDVTICIVDATVSKGDVSNEKMETTVECEEEIDEMICKAVVEGNGQIKYDEVINTKMAK